MGQDYLAIARSFQSSKLAQSVVDGPPSPEQPVSSTITISSAKPHSAAAPHVTREICEICEITPVTAEEINQDGVAKAYDTKATIAGGKPPLQEVHELQAWLSTIDWRHGLRCGRTGEQCRVCKGIPCQGSREWAHNQAESE